MSQRINYVAASPAGIKALGQVHGHIAQSGLDARLINLVYLRVSQWNGCAFCIDMHTRDLSKDGFSTEKLALVPVWREAGALFDARERAALAWAETVTDVAGTAIPDSAYEAVAQVFNDQELTDLTIAIGLINAYNRLGVAFRATPRAVAKTAAQAA